MKMVRIQNNDDWDETAAENDEDDAGDLIDSSNLGDVVS